MVSGKGRKTPKDIFVFSQLLSGTALLADGSQKPEFNKSFIFTVSPNKRRSGHQ